MLSDTIEGSIFLMLENKLKEIAKTLGKLDENGAVAEDLRSQILGQLGEGLKYRQIYAEALADPELRRTRQELEVAMENAAVAREAVFELFQDLDGFSLEDYQPLAEREEDRRDIIGFMANVIKTGTRRGTAGAAPPLLEILVRLGTGPWGGGPVLVPGCGTGHDVRALAAAGGCRNRRRENGMRKPGRKVGRP